MKNPIANTMAKDEILKLLGKEEFAGLVLRHTSLLEFDLDVLLCQYFIRKDRVIEAMSNLLSLLNLSNKIEILKSISAKKNEKTRLTIITNLQAFRKVRNIVAHRWTINTTDAEMLIKNSTIKAMLKDYPQSLRASFCMTRSAIAELIKSEEYCFDDKTCLSVFEIAEKTVFDE